MLHEIKESNYVLRIYVITMKIEPIYVYNIYCEAIIN